MNLPIKLVSKRTGLSPHVIRVWEKRYKAVEPIRTDTNRRLYSEPDVERLELLRQATLLGHSIGNIARLGTEEIKRLLVPSDDQAGTRSPITASRIARRISGEGAVSPEELLKRCVLAIKAFDRTAFEEQLQRGASGLGIRGLIERVAAPLAQWIGELWRSGEITAAHEHFASDVLRIFLNVSARPAAEARSTASLVVATPSGQFHDLGASMVAAAAVDLGWKVTYLGASLPAAEIAGAALQNNARAVALSIVYPEDDDRLPLELESLRRYLPDTVKLIVGGRASVAYGTVLSRIGALLFDAGNSIYEPLERLRENSSARPGNAPNKP